LSTQRQKYRHSENYPASLNRATAGRHGPFAHSWLEPKCKGWVVVVLIDDRVEGFHVPGGVGVWIRLRNARRRISVLGTELRVFLRAHRKRNLVVRLDPITRPPSISPRFFANQFEKWELLEP
jgi:hypothetical protein